MGQAVCFREHEEMGAHTGRRHPPHEVLEEEEEEKEQEIVQ